MEIDALSQLPLETGLLPRKHIDEKQLVRRL
jgi:hypothetical protein